MPTTTDQLPDLSQLKPDIQAILHKRDVLAEQLLEKCALICKGIQAARATVEVDLRQGVEARQFARSLANFKEYVSNGLEVYATVKEKFADWKQGAEAITPLVEEATAFDSWLEDLLARLN